MIHCEAAPLNPPGVKQYDTIVLTCTYSDSLNKPRSLDGITIKSQIRSKMGVLIDTLIVDLIDSSAGVFTLTPGITPLPIGIHSIDILFTDATGAAHSETFTLSIVPAVTAP